MTPATEKHLQEFADCFLPALLPQGWESMIAELDEFTADTVNRVDRFYASEYVNIQAEAALREAPGTCQMTYARTDNQADECYAKAFVSDRNSGLAMCRNCARMNAPEILEFADSGGTDESQATGRAASYAKASRW